MLEFLVILMTKISCLAVNKFFYLLISILLVIVRSNIIIFDISKLFNSEIEHFWIAHFTLQKLPKRLVQYSK